MGFTIGRQSQHLEGGADLKDDGSSASKAGTGLKEEEEAREQKQK